MSASRSRSGTATASVTGSQASIYSEQFNDTGVMDPWTIQDRISKRTPNPGAHLSSRKWARIRFGDRCRAGKSKPSPWHEIEQRANKNGRRQLIVLDDGTEYVGDWQNNLKHGVGTHYTAKGAYEGGFVDDLYEGEGNYYLWSDETNCELPGRWCLYSGEWYHGKFHGRGIKYELNGDTYKGEFRRGKRCGEGEMIYANGDKFTGEWSGDLRNGHGTLVKANGDSFVGYYIDDKRNGEGVLHIEKTKRRLEGVWEDDSFKCGSYYDEQEDPVYVRPDDISGTTDGMIPVLELKSPEEVLQARLNGDDGILRDEEEK